VDAGEVRTRMLAQFGIRIEPAMSQYVLRQLEDASSGAASFPVMGGDARTGVPVRRMIPASAFTTDAAANRSFNS
jgi:hypothetical protein